MNRRLLLKLIAASPWLATPALATPPRPERKPGAELPVLVLDPGHGGRDPGAIGQHGTREKNVVLDIAQEMAAQLEGKALIKLTRPDDRFLSLPERVAFARDAQANLLISVHADSAPDSPAARGISAYTLAETATDDFARKLAEGENIVDQRYGAAVHEEEVVADILYDLTARQTVSASRFAKEALIKGAGRDLRLLEQPKRSANFAVLRAPDVPSLLIETGFLSNPNDEEILRDASARKKIARILAREVAGILRNPLFS
jgi:N-acetylmuramoyl-L-alanine amidase